MTNYTPESIFYDTTNGLACPMTLREVVEIIKENWENGQADNQELFWYDTDEKGYTDGDILDIWDAIHPVKYSQEHWLTARKGD